ncbi:MAG: GTPase HflX [Chloroflexota bacterium]|nr:GTPase HflX [Chloroflexota bacterium]
MGLYKTDIRKERALLIAAHIKGKSSSKIAKESLEELYNLAESAGADPIKAFYQMLSKPQNTYVGTGKLLEIKKYIKELDIDVCIFDDELNPNTQKELENRLGIKVIDRTALILDIFSDRAQTHEGKLQVELAQSEYLMPRLAGQWSHLERLGGGIGTRGPGETQIETDRRLVREKIKRVKGSMQKIERNRSSQRSKRVSNNTINFSLVGYTNSGKSLLFNNLVKSKILSKNQLFSTLDTTTRKIYLDQTISSTISDTVGFINKLPTILVESFKSTLEEAVNADVLLHVIDYSNDGFEEKIRTVDNILDDLGLSEVPKLLIKNKIDIKENEITKLDLNESYINQITTSAKDGTGLKSLREQLLNLACIQINKKEKIYISN